MSKNSSVVKPDKIPYSKSNKISNKKKKKSHQISVSLDATPLVMEMYRDNRQMAAENARMAAELERYRTLRPKTIECVEGNIVEVE